jgi:Flp pilus assembly protein TadG
VTSIACLRRDRGSITIQYLILIPAMFALIFTCIQVAMYSYARSVALTAAQEGVNAQRVLGADPGAGYAQANRVVTREGDTLSRVRITVRRNGNEIVVTVAGRTQSVLPGFDGYSVSQTARGPIEEFTR